MTTGPHDARDAGRLWKAVDRLVDRAPLLVDLQSHKLELLAARRLRARGEAVPAELQEAERFARVAALSTEPLLARVAAAGVSDAVLMKGPEVAAAYPEPGLRGFHDLDLLVGDAGAAWEQLVAAGFEPIGAPELYVDIHHLRPLAAPGLPLRVEVHSRPKWPDRLPQPPVDELLAAATPSASTAGAAALPPAHHALVLAAHSWAHEPLRRLRDLVDIAAVERSAPRATTAALATRWGAPRLWRTTTDAIDALFYGESQPASLRLWARNLPLVRERTVVENHVQRLLSSFWALPPRVAAEELAANAVGELRPRPDETWREKVARSGRAVRNAGLRRSQHAPD